MDNIGERIQELRKGKKLTQTEFGKMFGVTHAHISSIERGREKPSEMFILFIIEKMNINEEWLRNGEGEMEKWLPNFGTVTLDENYRAKFNNYIAPKLKDFVNGFGGKELKSIIDTLSFFESSLMNEDFIDQEDAKYYLKEYENIIQLLELIISDANSLSVLKERKANYKDLLRFTSRTNQKIDELNSSIKNILNLYIDKYVANDELGFKVF